MSSSSLPRMTRIRASYAMPWRRSEPLSRQRAGSRTRSRGTTNRCAALTPHAGDLDDTDPLVRRIDPTRDLVPESRLLLSGAWIQLQTAPVLAKEPERPLEGS